MNRKKPGGEARLAYLRRIFRKIWHNFVIVSEALLKSGKGDIVIEWPAGCAYWGFPLVKSFVKAYKLALVSFNGCALDLKSIVFS